MVEGQLHVLDLARRVPPEPFLEQDRLRNRLQVRLGPQMRHHHDFAQAGQPRRDLRDARKRIVLPPRVAVAVGAEEDLRFDLAETLEHAVDAEIRRARGPHHALRKRGERARRGLGDVRYEGSRAVAVAQAELLQGLRCARYLAREFGIAQAAPKTRLVPENERVAAVAASQQVLCEIEPRLGKPLRPRHALAVEQHGRTLFRRQYAAPVPGLAPELGRMLDAPAVEVLVALELYPVAARAVARELRDLSVFDRLRSRLPDRLHGARVHGAVASRTVPRARRAGVRSVGFCDALYVHATQGTARAPGRPLLHLR